MGSSVAGLGGLTYHLLPDLTPNLIPGRAPLLQAPKASGIS